MKSEKFVIDAAAQADTRKRMLAFVAAKGHGSLKRLSDETGVSRQSISNFQRGNNAAMETLSKIEEYLEKEGWPGDVRVFFLGKQ